MPTPTREELIESIRRSGLLDEERLNRFLQESATASALATSVQDYGKMFVAANLITDWQLERLLEGKWRGFFLGKYKILYPLGAGAMGSVFLAEHKVMRHRVALKVLAKRLVSKPQNVARFEREARAAAVVNHPNVVRAYDIDADGQTHYLVMEYVQGENLQKIVFKRGPLDPLLAAEYTRQIARGLHEAHKNGLIHRDIKPSNVLLDDAGIVKILDLGLARIADDNGPSLTIANESKLLGTVDYLAPEQARNSHAIDGRADIYSLGCSLYFLLTGFPPFPSGSLTERIIKHQTRRPADVNKRRPGVPVALVNICNRMMEKNPALRYQTAGEAADDLSAFLEGRHDEVQATSTSQTAEDSDLGGSLSSLAEDSLAGKSLGPSSSRGMASRSTPSRSLNASQSMIGRANAMIDDLALAPLEEDKSKSVKASPSKFPAAPKSSPDAKPKSSPDARPKSSPTISAKATSKGENEIGPGESGLIPVQVSLEAPPVLGPSSDHSIFDDALSLNGSSIAGSQNGQSLFDALPAASDTISNAVNGTATNVVMKQPLDEIPAAAPVPDVLAKYRTEVEQEEGNFNYPLWILIGSGLLLSLILVILFVSYMRSFNDKNEMKADHREKQSSVIPTPGPAPTPSKTKARVGS